MNYTISGPGRTGGHLLAGIIKSTGIESITYTHDPEFVGQDDLSTTLILLDRRDRFAALMSNAITQRTGQSTNYSVTPESFEMDPGHFQHDYRRYIDYFKQHDLSRLYAGVYKLYLEDFVNNPQYVLDTLGLPRARAKLSPLARNPTPYHYEDIVTNWFELKTVYLRLRQGLHD